LDNVTDPELEAVGDGEGVVDCEVLSETGRDLGELLDWAVDENETDEELVEIAEALND
jgi:hypothetical protein